MGIKAGPKIVKDGLVFGIDATVSRSYSGSGLTVFDLKYSGIGGTLINGTGFSSANGGSFFFDGTNDYIISQNIDLSGTNAVSVTCWVKILNYREVNNSSNVVYEFSSNFNGFSTGFVVGFADGSSVWSGLYPVSVAVKGNAGYNLAGFAKTSVNDLAWHHWSCIFDKSISGVEGLFYLDGRQLSPISTPLQSDNGNNYAVDKLYIGSRDGANIPANANIADIKLYNRALTAQEILQNYNATKGRYI